MFYRAVFGLLVAVLLIDVTSGYADTHPNATDEYALREYLLTSYNRMVRPVLSPSHKVNVSFSLKLVSLISVDNKELMVTSKVLIKQSWQNPFLMWNRSKFEDIDRIRASSKEIWVPDFQLYNNAENPTVQSEYLYLYKRWVTVYHNGTNVWVSLAIYRSECDLDASIFPFDSQNCSLDFVSESYDANLLDVVLTDDLKELKPVSKSTGEWGVKVSGPFLKVKTSSFCSMPFVHVIFKLDLDRKATFYVLYLLCPCIVLSLLVFFSFTIPPENGERIGFCSSLLLSMNVYLLLFADLVPNNSKKISLLGVAFVVIFLETALALIATVIVLKFYHATSELPTFLKVLCCIQCGSKKKRRNRVKNQVIPKRLDDNKTEYGSREHTETGISLVTVKPVKSEAAGPASLSYESADELEDEREHNQKSWLLVARKLDRFFFWSFLFTLISSIGIVTVYNNVINEWSAAF